MPWRRREVRLDTERLTLRPPEPHDFRAWSALRRDSAAFLQPWEPTWAPDHLSRAAFGARVAWARRSIDAGTALPLFLLRREGNALVGAITLDNIRRGPSQSASTGYWIGAPFARQGFMREAVGAVVRHAFTALDLSRVEAGCLLTVSDIVVEGVFTRITDEELRAAVDRMTRLALDVAVSEK